MQSTPNYQIVISGVGGQGVLFVTRLLAEAAIAKGLPVFTSETHGMAQRGGTVISHLKVGDFESPLINPGRADGMIVLKAENVAQHGGYLKPGAWMAVNDAKGSHENDAHAAWTIDADTLAGQLGNPKSVNLILLGFALNAIGKTGDFFCTPAEIIGILEKRLATKPSLLEASRQALEAGASEAIDR